MQLNFSATPKVSIFGGKEPSAIQKALNPAMNEATAFLKRKIKKRLCKTGQLRFIDNREVVEKLVRRFVNEDWKKFQKIFNKAGFDVVRDLEK